MHSTNLFDQIPSLNTQIDFTLLPTALTETEVLVLSKINGLISLGELCTAYQIDRLEMERIVRKFAKDDLIRFADPQVLDQLQAAASAEGLDGQLEQEPLADVQERVIARHFEGVTVERERGAWDLDSIFKLINKIHHELRTGILRMYMNPETYKALFFEDGQLVNVSSVPFQPAECLGRVIQRAGYISQEKVIKSLERAKDSGRLQGEELVSMGAIREDILPEMLRVQLEVKLAEVMDWIQGEYEFQPVTELPPRITRVGIDLPRLLFALIWKRYPVNVLEKKFRGLMEKFAGRLDPPAYPLEEFSFGQSFEKFHNALLEKDNMVKRLMIVSHLKPDQTYRILWGLYLTGMIDFFDDTREDKTLMRIEELQHRLKVIEKETAFDILGVHWTATDRQIEGAYRKKKAELDAVVARTEGLEQHLNQQFLGHVNSAYTNVRSMESRRAYRNKIFDSDFIEFGSDILRQKGESYLFTKEDTDDAIAELEAAVEVYDKNGEYWSELGLALFIKHYPQNQAAAEDGRRMVKRGLEMAKNSEVAHLCMALLYRREKRQNQASEELAKVLRINPRNRFAMMELEEIRTGKTHADREKIVRDFVARRSKAEDGDDQPLPKRSYTTD